MNTGGLGQNNVVAVVPVRDREIIEMENRKRKKYQADLFSPEVIRSRLSAKKKLEADTDIHLEFLRSVDLNEVDNVKEDELLAISTIISMTICHCLSPHWDFNSYTF